MNFTFYETIKISENILSEDSILSVYLNEETELVEFPNHVDITGNIILSLTYLDKNMNEKTVEEFFPVDVSVPISRIDENINDVGIYIEDLDYVLESSKDSLLVRADLLITGIKG